jgi:prevent-host-death family protein
MKSLPLRELMRRPATVKKLTESGQSVRITDNGKPLWVLQPDKSTDEIDAAEEKARQDWTEIYFDDLLKEEPLKGMSAAHIVLESRGMF